MRLFDWLLIIGIFSAGYFFLRGAIPMETSAVVIVTCMVMWLCRRAGRWVRPFTDEESDPMAQAVVLEYGYRRPPRTALWGYRVLRTASRFFSLLGILVWPVSAVVIPIDMLIEGNWLKAVGGVVACYLMLGILTWFAKTSDGVALFLLARGEAS